MKKLITMLALTGLTASSFAQGTVNWTGVAGLFVGQTNSGTYSTLVGSSAGQATGSGDVAHPTLASSSGNLYYYALLTSASAPLPTTLAALGSSWSNTGLLMTNGLASNGRAVQVASAQNAVANNWAVSANQNIILVGWSANLGSDYATVLGKLQNWATTGFTANAYFGIGSSVGNLTIASSNPGITTMGTSAGLINDGAANPLIMNILSPVTPVPEPATILLLASGLALFLFGRRRSSR